jgi:hypothetical protein
MESREAFVTGTLRFDSERRNCQVLVCTSEMGAEMWAMPHNRLCVVVPSTTQREPAVAAAPGFSTEAVQTPARVNVTCVTPLGEEVASTS